MRWLSPYQTRAYSDGLAAIGVERYVHRGSPTVFFDRLSSPLLTAWETDLRAAPSVLASSLPGRVHAFSGLHDLAGVRWGNTAYCTLVVDLERPTCYSSSLRRNIRKAIAANVRHEVGFWPGAIELFADNAAFRAGIPYETFIRLVNATHGVCADVHAASVDGDPVAAAVVLRSSHVANVRFVGSTSTGRERQAMAFLYDRIIEDGRAGGLQFVDLSGVGPPDACDKLRRINAFKTKFTQLAAVFSEYRADELARRAPCRGGDE